MKQTLISLAIFWLLASCNQSEKKTVVENTTTPTQQSTDKTVVKTERQILIEELKQLQTVFASNDKEKIANIFSFPISNEKVGIYIDDPSFNDKLEKNGNKITRPMFINSYPDISESLQIGQINQLFTKLNAENLSNKETLDHEAIIKNEPCYHFYGVKIEKDLVTLTVGTKSNEDYKSKSVSEDEIPENDSAICEHVLWWVFKFDGKQLNFKEISGAG